MLCISEMPISESFYFLAVRFCGFFKSSTTSFALNKKYHKSDQRMYTMMFFLDEFLQFLFTSCVLIRYVFAKEIVASFHHFLYQNQQNKGGVLWRCE